MPKWSINPVALAGFLTPDQPLAPGWPGVLAALERAFGTGEAQAALALVQKIADGVDKPTVLADALASPAVRTAVERHPHIDWPRIVALLAPVTDARFAGPQGNVDGTGCEVAAYRDAGRLVLADFSYRDPVQGNAADCYLVASMIALAWAAPRLFRETVLAAAAGIPRSGALACNFHAKEGDATTTVTVSTRVPCFTAAAGDVPLYATSSNRDEDWPSLLEKAFVVHHARGEGEPRPADYVAVGADDERLQPQAAARMLVGGRAATCGSAVIGGERPSRTLHGLVDEARGVTRVPVMAWTWPAASHYLRGFDLASAGLFASHAYAVLGRLTAGGEYVVLRNPHGRNVDLAAYARGPWRPGPGANGADDVALDADGVFALPEEWFDRCFDTVGWLDPEP